MKHLFTSVGCLLFPFFLAAQIAKWTWVSGDTTANNPDSYGVKNLPDPLNKPGSRGGSFCWPDQEGNLWMHGGYVSTFIPEYGTFYISSKALWKFTIAMNAWTLVSGENGRSINDYGSRPYGGGAFWVDTSKKDVWFYGGHASPTEAGTVSAFYKFDFASDLWTGLGGGSTSYGTKGVASASNYPGARLGMINWEDAQGNFYLYGGYNTVNGGQYFADFWKYDTSANIWTWINGQSGTDFTMPVYGVRGQAAEGNTPGIITGIGGQIGWSDSMGRLWMYANNEIWYYSLDINQWTWIEGDHEIERAREFGTLGVPSANNYPGWRRDPYMWIDDKANLWLYGGFIEQSSFEYLFLNDLWKYTPGSGLWTWMGGDSSYNRKPDFGDKGIASTASQPGGRAGNLTWKDAEGNFWLFGSDDFSDRGHGRNDLWKLEVIDIITPVKLTYFTAAQKKQEVILTWNTSQEQSNKAFTIQRSSDGVGFATIGTVNAAGSSSTGSRYQFVDRAPASGNNFYRLKQVDMDGAFEYSSIVKIVIEYAGFTFQLLQNPVQQELRLSLQCDRPGDVQIQIKDAIGRLIITETRTISPGSSLQMISLASLRAGTYFITMIKDKKVITRRFVLAAGW